VKKRCFLTIAIVMGMVGVSQAANNYQYRRAPTLDIVTLVRGAASTFNIPSAWLAAIMEVESSYKVRAVSPAGALGLMQLMPQTAKRYNLQRPFDPVANVYAGAKHLRDLLDEFNGDFVRATAAYNAGSGAVKKYNGIPPYWETMQYVPKVLSTAKYFTVLEKKHFKNNS
jgi:soluble lytic murein transglycosylase-like protein